MPTCVLTEDDDNAHPDWLRELALRIPQLNNYTSCIYLDKQWK